jgi:hypothetical protein
MESQRIENGKPKGEAIPLVFERAPRTNDEGREVVIYRFQAAKERDQHCRAVPQVVPPGHQLYLRWLDDMSFEIGMRLVDAEAARKWTGAPGANLPPPPGHEALRRRELEKQTIEDLQTRAAELSISIPPKANKPMLAALILEAELAQAKPRKPEK